MKLEQHAVPQEPGLHACASLQAPRRFATDLRDAPRPGPDQLLVRVEGCGVCGSDLPAWQGRPWIDYPMAAGAPGHEAWGTVVACGPEGPPAGAPGVGTRVVGLLQHAYAGLALVQADQAVELPDDVEGFPAEAVACAVNAFARSGIRQGSDVAVVGIGFLGAVLVQLCAAQGARVTAISRRQWAVDLARELGADACVTASGPEDTARVLAQRTGAGDGFDVVVEATGHQAPLDLATNLTATRGRLVIAGYHQDRRTVDMQQWNWKGLDVINAHERDPGVYVQGIKEAVRRVQDGSIRLDPLLTHTFALDRIDDAFALLDQRPDGFLKAVVRP